MFDRAEDRSVAADARSSLKANLIRPLWCERMFVVLSN
jgi:hypothetical protein